MTLDAEILDWSQLTAEDRTQWCAWQKQSPALDNPFFRWEFAEIAARHVPQAKVARLHRGGQVIGYYPFQHRGSAIYPLAAPMNDYHGVVAAADDTPSLEEVVFALAPKRFNANSWAGPARTGDALETYQAVLGDGGYDDWYAARRQAQPKYFKDKERARRSMESQMGAMVVETGLKSAALLDRLLTLKSSQYRRTGRHDIFGVGWTRNLLHALLAYEGEGFGASLATLSVGDQLLAIEYSLHAGDRYHFWFPAYLEAGAKYSPGILLSMETMRAEQARGYRVFDYGFGGETYKKYFVNRAEGVREIALLRAGKISGLSHVGNRILDRMLPQRAESLRASVRRRWAAIEATEVTRTGRIKGAVLAGRRALAQISGKVS